MSRIPPSVAREVIERAGPYCEACGGPLTQAGAFHHRQPRSAGGTDTAVNLMLVHGGFSWNCHNLTEYSIHQNPTRSYRLGHLVRRGMDPATIPVTLASDLSSLRA